jgi:phosphatidylglycerol---prolipoprotein diacylglyceryl transferase
MSTHSVAAAGGLPFFELKSIDLGIELQWFGILVATGVLIGAHLARRYSDRFGCDDDDLRGMTAWVVVSGFLGAHVFDVLFYQWDKLQRDPWLLVKVWIGISSYGGFLGGAIGWFLFQWWKRLHTALWADITVVGLLPGFTIGRLGCTVVHDHIGRPTDFFLGVDYPVHEARRVCVEDAMGHAVCPEWLVTYKGEVIRLHNLGMNELLYLIPVNILILWLAFRRKPHPAGMLAVLAGLLYAPIRFFFEYLRPDQTDPRYVGLTFAQWVSIAAFAAAAYGLYHLRKRGKPARRDEELGPKEIGGRRDGAPQIAARDLDAAKKDLERAEKEKDKDRAATKGKAKGTGKGKGTGKAQAKARPADEPSPKDDGAAADQPDAEPDAEADVEADDEAKRPR